MSLFEHEIKQIKMDRRFMALQEGSEHTLGSQQPASLWPCPYRSIAGFGPVLRQAFGMASKAACSIDVLPNVSAWEKGIARSIKISFRFLHPLSSQLLQSTVVVGVSLAEKNINNQACMFYLHSADVNKKERSIHVQSSHLTSSMAP